MRKIIVLSMITLDGVMQAPNGTEEDTSEGFKYGGWVAPLSDEVYGKVVQEELQPAEAMQPPWISMPYTSGVLTFFGNNSKLSDFIVNLAELQSPIIQTQNYLQNMAIV